jgi:bifunctional UDP-N-acetylglucosamine pyrophosphorylase / glucosamine-1-phosphate N-acetyltransferase
VPHLSYIGDAEIGEGTNIAAGNVTANFSHEPGRPKGKTRIGRNVRTGVDNTFVAPVTVGDDAWLWSGTVVTDDVPPGSLAGFPPRQVTKEGWVYERGEPDVDDN